MRRGAIGPHRSPTTRHASFVAAQMRPDLERDGLGLTELEFVLAMLIELEIVEWGKVLQYDQSPHLAVPERGPRQLGTPR